MKFMYRLAQMMSGRYGVDRLFYIIFGLSITLSIINIPLRSVVIQLIVYALTTLGLFRMFSRNIAARSRENQFATGWIYKLKRDREIKLRRAADVTHVYKKCPNCRAVLRLPRRVGKHTTVCPKCSKQFRVTVRK